MTQDAAQKPTIIIFAPDYFAKIFDKFLENFATVYVFDPTKTALPHFVRPSHLVFFLLPGNHNLHLLKETLYYLQQVNPRAKVMIVGAVLPGAFQIHADQVLKVTSFPLVKVNLVRGVPELPNQFCQKLVDLLNGPANPLWQHLSAPAGIVPKMDLLPQITPLPGKVGRLNIKKTQIFRIAGVLLAAMVFLLVLVLGSVLIPLYQAVSEIDYLRQNFSKLPLDQTKVHLISAQTDFETSRTNFARLSSFLSALGAEKNAADIGNLLELGEEGSSLGVEFLDLVPGLQAVAYGVADPLTPTYSDSVIYSFGPQLDKISVGLLRVESKIKNVPVGWKQFLFGPNYPRYEEMVSQGRSLSAGMAKLSPVLGTILGSETRKNYLVIFQNPAEIRATGGFIGSFALVSFDRGKMINLLVQDIYEADGQLSGKIAPPDEILYYMGQPNWYMRDSNWAIDFPLTARRLEWFLQKETGEKVDGVVAVDIHAIEKLLKATGPIKLTDFNETVDSSNLFEKIEYQSEINFFPGSTQKRDFLDAVMSDFLAKLTSGKLQNPPALLSALNASLNEKNLLFYLNDPLPQSTFTANNWAGQASPPSCSIVLGKRQPEDPVSSCFGFYDSNIGGNKANYYLQRSSETTLRIGKAGDVDVTMTVHYQNDSPSRTWPGGDYKNYLRFALPLKSTVENITLGDNRLATVSAVLNSKIIASLPSDKFLVKQSSESGVLELGMLTLIPVGSSGSASITFRLPYQVDFTDPNPELGFTLLKQPGTPVEAWNLTIEYPSFLTPLLDSSTFDRSATVVFAQKLVYNGVLDQDKTIQLRFGNRNP